MSSITSRSSPLASIFSREPNTQKARREMLSTNPVVHHVDLLATEVSHLLQIAGRTIATNLKNVNPLRGINKGAYTPLWIIADRGETMGEVLNPKVFETMMVEKRDAEIQNVRQSYVKRKDDVRIDGDVRIKNAEYSFSSRANLLKNLIIGIVWVCGLVISVSSCNSSVSSTYSEFHGYTSHVDLVKAFVIPGIVLLSCLFAHMNISERKPSRATLDAEIKVIQSSVQADLERLDAECERRVAEIERDYERRIAAHTKEYEAAQRMASVSFVDSPVTKEISDFLLQSFLETIRSRDRRPHIEIVYVPFSFQVFKDKVISAGGTYDFEVKRVAFLRSLEEQAALANAIATMIHTEVISAFPIDPSGGEVDPMDITYEYGKDYVKASMAYRAANANYVAPRSF